MKTYRIQVRYAKLYFDFTTKAESSDDAAMIFIKKLNEGSVEAQPEGVYTPDRLFITYEEGADVTTQQTVRQEA